MNHPNRFLCISIGSIFLAIAGANGAGYAVFISDATQKAPAWAKTSKPLTVGRAAAGMAVALEQCQEGIWHCELNKNKVVEKQRGGMITVGKCPERESR
jgi:hypothetical protein